VAIVDKWKRRVLEEALTVDQVKVSKSMTKPIDGYAVKQKLDGTDSALPEHVRVAKVMLARGADIGEGTRIEFYMHDHPARDVRPAEDYAGECDRHYLWENKLYPACQRLFEGVHPGHNWKQYGKSRPQAPRKRRELTATPLPPKRGIRRSQPAPAPKNKDSN
jgi:DNA polymerase elongation subunit (family B)